ncbi:hypothetical protein BHE74_00025364 [Ensete ventricosum]|nr:hypothetical protein BHE74_00025364 [Ensete ventricosum]
MDFSELSINVVVLRCSEANQELSLELSPRRDSVIGLVQIAPLDRVCFKLNGGDLYLGFLRSPVRLLLRRKAAAASRGSRKQGNSEGGRCGSKDGWGGWAALECAATAALDLQAGRVSKAKGAVMLRLADDEGLVIARSALPRVGQRQWQGSTGGRQHHGVRQRSMRLGAMGGSKDGDGLRGEDGKRAARLTVDNRVRVDGRQQQQRSCAWQCYGRGGSDEGLATTGCALPSGREAREEGSIVGCGRGARGWERWVAARMATACVGKTAARPTVGSDGAAESDEGCGRGERQRADRW